MANSTSPSSVATTITGIAAGMALAHYLRPVLVPFFLAALLRIGVDAVVQMIANVIPRAPRWTIRLTTGGVMAAAIMAICYVVAQGIGSVASQVPAIVAKLDAISRRIAFMAGAKDADLFSAAIRHIDGPALLQWLASGIHEPFEIVLLTLLMSAFMLAAPSAEHNPKVDLVARHAARAARQRAIIAHITSSIQNYMVVQLATNGAIGIAVAVACFAIGLKGAMFWGATSFILAFIPVVGPIVASVLPALSALVQSSTEWQAVAVFVAVQVIFTVLHNLVLPKLQAESQNIDPIAGLLALGIWTLLWGVWGALLATPLMMLIMITMAQFESSRWFAALLSHDGRPETGADVAE